MKRKGRPIDTLTRSGYRSPQKTAPSLTGGGGRLVRIRWFRILGVLLLLCAVVVAIMLLARFVDYRSAQQEYAAYAALPEGTEWVVPTQGPTPEPAQVAAGMATFTPMPAATPLPTKEPFVSEKVQSLMKQNKDTVGFIEVPGTDVQYPVVQGDDNVYYMTHTFAKKNRAAGAIFLDAWNSGSLTDFNTVVYGHNMKDGSMFAPLREYRHADFLREHKYVEITLLHSKKTYKVFAAYIAEDGFDFRGFGCATDSEKAGFIKRITYKSEIDTNATAAESDSILTLVTCTSGERDRYWIVHPVLVEEVATKE